MRNKFRGILWKESLVSGSAMVISRILYVTLIKEKIYVRPPFPPIAFGNEY